MIEPVKARNKYWVNSVQLYDLLGREKSKYGAWITRYILSNNSLEVQKDYYVHSKFIAGWKNAHRTEYYLSIALTFAICIREGTVVSKNIRLGIETIIKQKIKDDRLKKPNRF